VTVQIPWLGDLGGDNEYGIPLRLIEAWFRLHAGNGDLGQSHFEILVGEVLLTDAVHPRASRRQAMFQAVGASVPLMEQLVFADQCWKCGGRGAR
jgi:hypothetical protein